MQTLSPEISTLALMCCLCAACGGEVEFGGPAPLDQGEPSTSRDDAGHMSHDLPSPVREDMLDMSSTLAVDMSTASGDMTSPPRDLGSTPQDMTMPEADMGMPPLDMGPPAGPPPSASVETVINQGCTTTVVKGLSEQLIEEMNCIDPGIVSSFAYLQNLNLYAAVFPFLQTPAVEALDATVRDQNTLTISSALRTVPQQYLLYRWYRQGRCNISLAASPGRSNHNGAKAIDTPDYTAWKTRFQANSWTWLGGNDPVHFTFNGGKDIRALSVLAFQKLWNRNNPNDPLAEDGDYGPNTEAKLKQAPSNGFAIPPWCPSSRHYRDHERRISPTVRLLEQATDHVTLEAYVSSVVQTIRYTTAEGEVTHERALDAPPNFRVTLPTTDALQVIPFHLTTLDASGEELRTTRGVLPGSRHVAMMPEGAGVYRLRHGRAPEGAHRMVLWVDGVEVLPDPTSMESGDPFDLMLSLRPHRDEMKARRVEVVIEDIWGNRIEQVDFDLMITH